MEVATSPEGAAASRPAVRVHTRSIEQVLLPIADQVGSTAKKYTCVHTQTHTRVDCQWTNHMRVVEAQQQQSKQETGCAQRASCIPSALCACVL